MEAPFLLASRSPRRRVLLAYLVPEFKVGPVDVTEEAPRNLPIGEAVAAIARKKAIAASKQHAETWVLGADTVVSMDGSLIGKARSEAAFREHMARLEGREHEVTTGFALAWDGDAIDAGYAVGHVRMDVLPSDVREAYFRSQAWRGKAGGYGIQDRGLAGHVRLTSGAWSNVVGLPLQDVHDMLRRNDVPCLEPPDEAWLRQHNPF